MDKEQKIQEEQYSFPYHHIPELHKRRFSQARILPWGYSYLAYLGEVLDYIGKRQPASLLDIGCGDGKFLLEARKRMPEAVLWGNDYSEQAIALAKSLNFNKNVNLSTDRASLLVRNTGPFDVVTAIEVLEHIPPKDVGGFCADFASALSPQGIGVITVPSDNVPLNRKHYMHFDADTLEQSIAPHLKVVDMFYLNEISWRNWLIQKALGNRFFILNYHPLVTRLYNYYRRNLLKTRPEKCERLMAVVKKALPDS